MRGFRYRSNGNFGNFKFWFCTEGKRDITLIVSDVQNDCSTD